MERGSDKDLLADLNPTQQEAVQHLEGPLLILAGAGSGKTRVITRRVAYLLQQGIAPGSILAITFTNQAAGEMRHRIEALVPQTSVWISTFHSMGARLLRLYGDRLSLSRNFTILDQTDRARLMKLALEDAGLDESRYKPETLSQAISKAKNQLLSPEKYGARAGDFFTQTVGKIYPIYEKRLRDANALDFDDLLYWLALALKNDQELRAELDARFKYILIDEYQDTNLAQYSIIRSLSQDHPNLCVVGDPDQSIYKFRGSDIRNILDFEQDFPNARVLTLSTNYRSTRAILQAASQVIAHNKKRKPKTLQTDNPEGQPVTVLTFDTGETEAEGIARRIKEAVTSGKRRYRDFAVFLRINALTRGLERAFTVLQVPFQIVKGLAFFDRKENRDVLAYLQLLLNPRNELALERIINEPPRGIGPMTMQNLRHYAEPRELSLLEGAVQADKIPLLKPKMVKALQDFARMIFELSKKIDLPPDEIIREVLDRTGYRQMLKESKDEEDADRLANIEEMITSAQQFSRENPEAGLAEFVENITLASDVDSWNQEQDTVSVMTMHSAKGLEFPVVFLAAMEQGLIPHERSLSRRDEDEIEEERRLAFVGMTRAREELYLTRARTREFRGQTLNAIPSMFLEELPRDMLDQVDHSTGATAADHWRSGSEAAEQGWHDAGVRSKPRPIQPADLGLTGSGHCPYAVGMKVKHENYGAGQVIEVSGHGLLTRVKVRFRTAGERSFIADKVKLEILPGG